MYTLFEKFSKNKKKGHQIYFPIYNGDRFLKMYNGGGA